MISIDRTFDFKIFELKKKKTEEEKIKKLKSIKKPYVGFNYAFGSGVGIEVTRSQYGGDRDE